MAGQSGATGLQLKVSCLTVKSALLMYSLSGAVERAVYTKDIVNYCNFGKLFLIVLIVKFILAFPTDVKASPLS
jgi:hypothetical protein